MSYWIKLVSVVFLCVMCALSGCNRSGLTAMHITQTKKDGPPPYPVDVSKIPEPIPHPLQLKKACNRPYYWVRGKRYHVLPAAHTYKKRGIASWYGTRFHGHATATGETYNLLGMTAASTELAIPSFVRVTNLENRRSVVVKVSDRGPFHSKRIIDLSWAAAAKLGYAKKGTAVVQVESIHFNRSGRAFIPSRVTAHSNLAERFINRPHLASQHSSSPMPGIPTYVRVATFKQHQSAKALQSRLTQATKQPVVIQRLHVNRNAAVSLYRVQVQLPQEPHASRAIQERLKHMGLHVSAS